MVLQSRHPNKNTLTLDIEDMEKEESSETREHLAFAFWICILIYVWYLQFLHLLC